MHERRRAVLDVLDLDPFVALIEVPAAQEEGTVSSP